LVIGTMERYCSTGQSPQRAVAPTEEEVSCISSYMFRLVYRAIFRLVFRVVCMYNCWCFESYEISYYK
jgi:hypothetical protein